MSLLTQAYIQNRQHIYQPDEADHANPERQGLRAYIMTHRILPTNNYSSCEIKAGHGSGQSFHLVCNSTSWPYMLEAAPT